ncbi:hypothetical protein GCM10023238_23720 [Streptomyces heliomycini]
MPTLLQQAVTQQAAASGSRVTTVDVVPAAEGDPRGRGPERERAAAGPGRDRAGAAVTLLGLRGARAWPRWPVATLVGAAAAALAPQLAGRRSGEPVTVAGTFALAALAMGATVAGLAALLGRAGIALGGLVIMLLGNPFSGASSAPEMLAEPPGRSAGGCRRGAGVSLTALVSFFDGAGRPGPP